LVDKKGNVLARLADSPGGGVLALESRGGSEQVVVGVIGDSAGISVILEDRVRASLTVGGEGLPALNVRDGEGRARIIAGLDAKELPSISLGMRSGV
jgi:hypothetical protein